MPRKPKARKEETEERTVVEEADDLDGIEEQPTEEELENQAKLSEFQSQFSGRQYKILIEKKNEDTHEWEWVERVAFEGFDPITLSKKYGGGAYRCTLFDQRLKYVKGGKMYFSFAKTITPEVVEKKSALEDPVVQMMIEQQKSQMMMVVEMMKSFAPMQANQQQSKADLGAIISAVKDVMMMTNPKSESGMKTFSEMLEMQLKMRDLFDGGEKDSGGFMDELKEAFKLVMQSRGLPAGQRPPQPPTSRVVVAKPGGLPVATKKEETSEMPKLSNAAESILFYVPKFVKAAEEKADPQKWAEYLLNVLDTETVPLAYEQYKFFLKEPEDAWDYLVGWAEDKEKRELIFKYAPALEPHREWVEAVVLKAIETFNAPDDNPISETANQNGVDG